MILSAAKNHRDGEGWVSAATASMLRLNRHASHLARRMRLRAATDITGFGLLGHLWEMAERSGVVVDIHAAAVPLLPGARACSASGVHTGGEGRNRAWVGANAVFKSSVDSDTAALLFDPQTSGGLLLACPRRRAPALEAAFAADGEALWRIGRVLPGTPQIKVV
jgi:selenide,water dikinase